MAKENTSRETSIDLIKFIACVLIVVLHAITPSENVIQETVYLLGSYGIPLFFMVNGYLRRDKQFTFGFAWKMTVRYVKFIAFWALLLGTAKLLLQREFVYPRLFAGAIIGFDSLYHLWFLTGLLILYYILAVGSVFAVKRNTTINVLLKSKSAVIISLTLMSLSFLLNLFLKFQYGAEIRDFIHGPFRIITNGGYFLIGMNLGLREIECRNKNSLSLSLSLLLEILFFITVIILSKITGILWASSYYDFPGIIFGTVILFSIIQEKTSGKIPAKWLPFLGTSSGIWIFHPFVVKLLNKVYQYFFGTLTLPIRIGILIFTIFSCLLVTLLFEKNKYLRKLIRP